MPSDADSGRDNGVFALAGASAVLPVLFDAVGVTLPPLADLAVRTGPLAVAAVLLAARGRRPAATGFAALAAAFPWVRLVDVEGSVVGLLGVFGLLLGGVALVFYDVLAPRLPVGDADPA